MVLGEPADSFRQHSETLVGLDCNGQVRPALASEWTGDSTGRTWTFTLRSRPAEGATPLTAAAVVSAWRDRGPAVAALGIDSAIALDDGRLRVTLRTTLDPAPRLFADPALAVATPENASSPHFRVAPERDPRDALDHGADLVVTRDPAVVDYVAGRPEFTTFPLPWSRVYGLLQPASASPIGILSVDSVRRSLAEDVAQAEARAAQLPFLWTRRCPFIEVSYVVAPLISPRIVYPREDKVARGVAERIVALTRDSVQLKTAGLDSAAFALALRQQRDRGYVLGFPRQVPAPCHELAKLPAGSRVYPLIETRAQAIQRKRTAPLTIEWDGTLRVVEP